MNQILTVTIQLIDLFPPGVFTAFGSVEGRKVYQELALVVSEIHNGKNIEISLEGISKTDASFPRESVVALIKSLRAEQGLYLSNFLNQDLMDNWDYAAKAKNQNLIVIQDQRFKILGPRLNESTTELLKFIFSEGTVTTSKVTQRFEITPQNAIGRLKKLYSLGLLLGSKETAASGGVEYQFRAIKNSD